MTLNLSLKHCSLLLIGIHAAIFLWANTRPIEWQQPEILCHGFFWSMDGISDYRLHSGIEKIDFLKLLDPYQLDGAFRPRFISYFFEMLSFKFWQLREMPFFRNYSLIALHLINAVLLGRLIYLLTKNFRAVLFGVLLFLNSGIALATLLFPFRNAKLLVMTSFLLAWIAVAGGKQRFVEAGSGRWIATFSLFFLAVFTDEYAVFLFPLIFIYVAIRDGARGLINRRFALWLGVFAVACALCLALYWRLSRPFYPPTLGAYNQLPFVSTSGDYLLRIGTYRDLIVSFLQYFLPRNFGYWDFDPLGAAAFVAFGAMLIIGLRKVRLSPTAIRLAWAVGLVIFLKVLLWPHNLIHEILMPSGTVFPSMLFFSFYYPYSEALLVSLLAGIIGEGALSQGRGLVVLGLLAAVMSFSSAVHLQKGPQDILSFNRMTSEHFFTCRSVQFIKRVLKSKASNGPVYLSFPSGDAPELRATLQEHRTELAAHLIVPIYLSSLESGRAMVSYTNVRPQLDLPAPEEVSSANYFYDVLLRKGLDLNKFRDQLGRPAMQSTTIVKPWEVSLVNPGSAPEIIFFLKGRADFELQTPLRGVAGVQNYGYAYQVFVIPFQAEELRSISPGILRIVPRDPAFPVSVVGPFFWSGALEDLSSI